MKDKKNPDIRVILLMLVFIGLPVLVFISWIIANNELATILKMIIIAVSAGAVTLIYRGIRYVFTIKMDRPKMKFLSYIVVQSISLIVTLIVILGIVEFLNYI